VRQWRTLMNKQASTQRQQQGLCLQARRLIEAYRLSYRIYKITVLVLRAPHQQEPASSRTVISNDPEPSSAISLPEQRCYKLITTSGKALRSAEVAVFCGSFLGSTCTMKCSDKETGSFTVANDKPYCPHECSSTCCPGEAAVAPSRKELESCNIFLATIVKYHHTCLHALQQLLPAV